MGFITINEAVSRYKGISATRIRNWCKNNKINGAQQFGPRHEWRFPIANFEEFLNQNHPELLCQTQQFQSEQQLQPGKNRQMPISPLWVIQERVKLFKDNVIWDLIFSIFAPIIGLVNDIVGVIGLISTFIGVIFIILLQNQTSRYLAVGILSFIFCCISGYIVLAKDNTVKSKTKNFRYTNTKIRKLFTAFFWSLLIFLVVGSWYFYQWKNAPPQKTIILVADFVDAEGKDPGLLTQRLIKEMNTILSKFPDIEVIPLNQPITEKEGGSIEATRIANEAEYKATIVIWGYYTRDKEDEVYVNFDIVRESVTYYTGKSIYAGLDKSLSESYSQDQIESMGSNAQHQVGELQVPRARWINFKAKLGQRYGRLAAFVNGLAAYASGNHKSAIPLFETAIEEVKPQSTESLDRAIWFYKAANLISAGQIAKGSKDLLFLIPNEGVSPNSIDVWGAMALATTGTIAAQEGKSEQAMSYLSRSLDVYVSNNNVFGRAEVLKLICLVKLLDTDYQGAQTYIEKALGLYSELSDHLGQAESLTVLGIISWPKPSKEKSGSMANFEQYIMQALDQFDQAGNIIGKAQSYTLLATSRVFQSKNANYYYSRAESTYKQIIKMNIPVYDQIALLNLGNIAMSKGDFISAYNYFNLSLENAKKTENVNFQGFTLIMLLLTDINHRDFTQAQQRRIEISIYISKNKLLHLYPIYIKVLEIGTQFLSSGKNYDLIQDYYLEVQLIYQIQGDPIGQAREFTNLGEIAYQSHKYVEAGQYLLQAKTLVDTIKEPLNQDFRRLGNLALSMGTLEQNAMKLINDSQLIASALVYYSIAADIYNKLEMKSDQANVLGVIGVILLEQGDQTAAKQYLEVSKKIYLEIGDTPSTSVLEALKQLSSQ